MAWQASQSKGIKYLWAILYQDLVLYAFFINIYHHLDALDK
jgi:hypothetical protein